MPVLFEWLFLAKALFFSSLAFIAGYAIMAWNFERTIKKEIKDESEYEYENY